MGLVRGIILEVIYYRLQSSKKTRFFEDLAGTICMHVMKRKGESCPEISSLARMIHRKLRAEMTVFWKVWDPVQFVVSKEAKFLAN